MSGDEQTVIEVFSDYVCPWCYLASAVVEKIEQSHNIDIHWTPFPLHPDTPQDGLLLSSFLGPNLDAVHERLYSIMDELGLPHHNDRTMTYNSRLAQELGMWGETQDNGKALHKQLFRTYFLDNQNLAQKDVLLQSVANAGLDAAEAEQVIDERRFSPQVDEAWKRARQFQVTGVPSFIAGSYATTGYHPYEELAKFIEYVEMQQAKGG